MASSDSKIEKVQKNFAALSSVATELNTASNKLTEIVTVLDEALRKLNVGLSVWVTFRSRDDDSNPERYDNDQIGYCKIQGIWGIALRRIWGSQMWGDFNSDGPWLFNDASRDLRLRGVDKIPELIEALGKEASDFTNRLHKTTQEVHELAEVIVKMTSQQDGGKGRK
jgi:methyl-accepting chemotaxis protein